MNILFMVFALLSAMNSALPAPQVLSPPNDGRGATIFTEPNMKGHSTAIPANAWCTNLNNLFGSFDGKVRSMIVEKGMRCQFHVNHGCPSKGWQYEFGSKELALGLGELPAWLDQKIHSVYCTWI